MTRNSAPFEITLNGMLFTAEPGFTGLKVYRLSGDNGSYLIAKDFYDIWVELNRAPGSVNISLNQVGRKIDEHYAAVYDPA